MVKTFLEPKINKKKKRKKSDICLSSWQPKESHGDGKFCVASGLKVNMEKSHSDASKNDSNIENDHFNSIMGFPHTF